MFICRYPNLEKSKFRFTWSCCDRYSCYIPIATLQNPTSPEQPVSTQLQLLICVINRVPVVKDKERQILRREKRQTLSTSSKLPCKTHHLTTAAGRNPQQPKSPTGAANPTAAAAGLWTASCGHQTCSLMMMCYRRPQDYFTSRYIPRQTGSFVRRSVGRSVEDIAGDTSRRLPGWRFFRGATFERRGALLHTSPKCGRTILALGLVRFYYGFGSATVIQWKYEVWLGSFGL